VQRGFAGTIASYLDGLLDEQTGGVVGSQNQLADQLEAVQARIDATTDRLEKQQKRLEAQYARLEATLARLDAQRGQFEALLNQLAGNSSSNSTG
jgi:flagellar capping protein FliD